jgi:hypothetical protein
VTELKPGDLIKIRNPDLKREPGLKIIVLTMFVILTSQGENKYYKRIEKP